MIAGLSMADLLSGAAATLTTASFVPQAAHVLRTRDTGAISLTMYTMFAVGVCLWEIYGLMTGQWAIIAANAITLVLALLILVMKVRGLIHDAGSGPAGEARPDAGERSPSVP